MQDHSPLTSPLILPSKIPKAGFQGGIWRQYDRLAKLFGCKQQSELVVTIMGSEEKKKNNLKKQFDNRHSATRLLCLDKKSP